MNIRTEIDRDDNQILAVYVHIREGLVSRTVEIAEGACYADEDEHGNLLGIEMLAPGNLHVHVNAIATHYPKEQDLRDSLTAALEKVPA